MKRIDLLQNETFWRESMENAAYSGMHGKSTSRDPMHSMISKAVELMKELAEYATQAKGGEPTPSTHSEVGEIINHKIDDLGVQFNRYKSLENHIMSDIIAGKINILTELSEALTPTKPVEITEVFDVDRIESQIASQESTKEIDDDYNPDRVSWPMEHGVLITLNEAKTILTKLNQ